MVCVPVDELDDPSEGSTQTACVDCGRSIWISPESRAEMYEVGAMPMCHHCAEKQAETRPVEVRGKVATEMGLTARGQFDQLLGGLQQSARNFTPLAEGEDVFEVLKEQAAMAGREMRRPGDDWGSLVVMVDFKGLAYPPLPLGKMMDVVPKEVIARQLIPALAYTAQAERVVFGFSSWTLENEDGIRAVPEGPISEHPDRKEKLVLIDVTADGVQRMSFADIVRDGVGPPRLGEWHDAETPEASDGLFVDALVPALQGVKAAWEGSSS